MFRFVARFEEDGGAAHRRGVQAPPPVRVEAHPLPLERRVELDPVRRPRARHRPGERDVVPGAGRAAALPRRPERDRAALPVRALRVREQGGAARRQPLRDDGRGPGAPRRARPADALGGRAGRSASGSAEPPQRRGQHLDRERDVLVARQLVGRVADAAVEAADEEHPRLDAGRREHARVVARARRAARPPARAPRSTSSRSTARIASSCATAARSAPGSRSSAPSSRASRSSSGARTSTVSRTRPGSRSRRRARPRAADRRDGALDRARGVTRAQDVLGRLHERVVRASIGVVPACPALPSKPSSRRV